MQNGVSMTCIDNCIMEKDKVMLLKHMTLYHNDQIIIMQNSVIMTCIDKLCTGKATLECDSGSVTIRFACLMYFLFATIRGALKQNLKKILDFWTFTFLFLFASLFFVFPGLGRVLQYSCKVCLIAGKKVPPSHPNSWAKVHPPDFSIIGSLAAASL